MWPGHVLHAALQHHILWEVWKEIDDTVLVWVKVGYSNSQMVNAKKTNIRETCRVILVEFQWSLINFLVNMAIDWRLNLEFNTHMTGIVKDYSWCFAVCKSSRWSHVHFKFGDRYHLICMCHCVCRFGTEKQQKFLCCSIKHQTHHLCLHSKSTIPIGHV